MYGMASRYTCKFRVFFFQVYEDYHLEPVMIGGKKRFPCPYCSQPFSSKFNVKTHIKARHMGVKSVCSCGREFTFKGGLVEHMKATGHAAAT